MHYRIIRDCRINGSPARVGDIISVDEATASQLMAMGRVVPHTEDSNNSDRQVKKVETREGTSETDKKVKPRTSRGRSKSSKGNSKSSS